MVNIEKLIRDGDSKDLPIILIEQLRSYVQSVADETFAYKNFCYVYNDRVISELEEKYADIMYPISNELDFFDGNFVISPTSYKFSVENKFFVYKLAYLNGDIIEEIMFVFYNDPKDFTDVLTTEKFVRLKKGIYQLVETNMGTKFIEAKPEECMNPILNEDWQDIILKDINTFFQNEEFYVKEGFSYKRGLLMYGPGGTGKSSVCKYIGQQVGVPTIIINNDVRLNAKTQQMLETACGDGVVIVLEDIDGVDSYLRSAYLNFLDGITSPRKAYFIATTNYIENVDYAFRNRPSRFDVVLEVGLPDKETRKKIIELYFKDKAKTFDLDKLADLTKDFTGAYFKELYILYRLNKLPIEEVVKQLRKRMDILKKKEDDFDDYTG